MGSEAAEIRQAIEQTRAELGETVQALAYKADVKARVNDKVSETKRRGQESAHQVLHKVAEASEPAAKVASEGRLVLPLSAAMAVAGAILLALRARRHGRGQH